MGRTLGYFGEGRGVAPHGWVAPGDQMGCWGHRAAEKLQFTGGGVGVWVAWRKSRVLPYGHRDLPAGVAWRGVNCSFSARPAALGCATGGGLLWRGNRRTFGLGMADLRTWLSGVCHGDLDSVPPIAASCRHFLKKFWMATVSYFVLCKMLICNGPCTNP